MNLKTNPTRWSYWIKSTTHGRFEPFTGYFETEQQAEKWMREHGNYFLKREQVKHEFELRQTKLRDIVKESRL